jgi:hypothetical protein
MKTALQLRERFFPKGVFFFFPSFGSPSVLLLLFSLPSYFFFSTQIQFFKSLPIYPSYIKNQPKHPYPPLFPLSAFISAHGSISRSHI